MDVKVLETQNWLNQTYASNPQFTIIVEDGITGRGTIKALIKALQIEIGESVIDGIFGAGTASKFDTLFPNGLSESTNNSNQSIRNIIYILQGGFFCRGINPNALTGEFGIYTTNAVMEFQNQAGIIVNGTVTAKIMKAILTTDAFTLLSSGDINIRDIQQALNLKYFLHIDLIPTNGIGDKKIINGLIAGLQKEANIEIDGVWGPGTMNNACPTLQQGSTNKNAIYILQYALYVNGFNPNGFDGGFGNGVKTAVTNFQKFVKLTADGICGKQTWASLLISYGDKNRTVIACDTSKKITHQTAAILKNNGYQIVGRYLTGKDKGLTIEELNIIFEEGLKLFVIYQENGRVKENFTKQIGIQNASKAYDAAKRLGIPSGSTIYFAIDFDATNEQVSDYIIPYFEGIYITLDNTYKIGIYGARNICSRVTSNGYATSSFVADSSSGYSGNAGFKLPDNWTYDQIVTDLTITDSINGTFLIDKDVFSENVSAINHLEHDNNFDYNQDTFEKIKRLYDLATEYRPYESVSKRNELVLQYLRHRKYSGWQWAFFSGIIDTNFISYVEDNSNNELNLDKILIYSTKYNVYMDLEHLAASLSPNIYLYNTSTASIRNKYHEYLTGWAGDLLQLAGQLQKKFDQNNNLYNFSSSQIKGLVGCNDDNYVRSLGFSEYHSPSTQIGFSLIDLLQDVDAINLGEPLKQSPINIAFENYYTNTCSTRFTQFANNIRGLLDIESNYNILYNSAYGYTAKVELTVLPLIPLFEADFGYYNSNIWGEKLADAFANKIIDLISDE